MNILYFHQHFSTPKGSTGLRSYFMAKKLIKDGHKVTVVCGSFDSSDTGIKSEFKFGKREGQVDGITVIELNLKYSNHMNLILRSLIFFLYSLRCTLIALSRDYDVVVASSTPLTAAIPGIIAKIFRSKKFVFEVRDLWPELPVAMGVIKNPIIIFLLKYLEKTSYWAAHKCIGLSDGISKGIKKNENSKTEIFTIPNGCDNSLIQQTLSSKKSSSMKKVFRLIYSGTHGIANGLDYLIDCAKELQKVDEEIEILLVGDGMKKNHLKKRVENEKIKNISFYEPMPKTDLFKLYEDCDVGLQILSDIPAFYHGTSPNKFFDYISADLPVINNYPGWIADEISSYECGIFVKPNCSNSFVDTVIGLKKNKEVLKTMKNNCKNLAIKYDRVSLSKKWVEVVTKW